MNAREHAEHASRLAESATECHDDERRSYGIELAELAQAHALTSLALSALAPRRGGEHRSLIDELSPGAAG